MSKYGTRIAIITVILAMIIVAVSSLTAGRAGALQNADGALKSPVQKATSAVLDWFEGLYGYIYDYDRIVEENNTLRAENAKLRQEARDYADIEAENARFRELLGFQEKHTDFVMEQAKIVGWETSNYSSAFTISKGSKDGLEEGDCVITEYGALVGQVIELGTEWATVRTVVDVDMDLGALVGQDKYAGIITGEFSLMKKGMTRLTYLASGAQIFTNDEVITSGKGGGFPAGLAVGTISSVVTEAGGQVTYGIVTPACDISRLSQVFVIKEFEIVE